MSNDTTTETPTMQASFEQARAQKGLGKGKKSLYVKIGLGLLAVGALAATALIATGKVGGEAQ